MWCGGPVIKASLAAVKVAVSETQDRENFSEKSQFVIPQRFSQVFAPVGTHKKDRIDTYPVIPRFLDFTSQSNFKF
jgi:hypothetical protein